ncbi:MAG: ribonuclease H-like domain-containing protein [Lachnospiraceae bacterium]|nr:ribonuclease H-like domain-containing protein [Lachnospiraceae bacterium]
MKIIQNNIPVTDDYYICHYFADNSAFFDIETTGFSAKTAFVYLIGMAIRRENQIEVYQFLAENHKDEEKVLQAFFDKLETIEQLICFNGIGFDIPFLNTRCKHYSISSPLSDISIIDLYKITCKLAIFLQLPNRKQKTLEHFLGITREDIYTGGELIKIYYAYEKTRDAEAEKLLLLHNFEDVVGMTNLLAIMSYEEVFSANIRGITASAKQNELLLILEASVAFPQTVFYPNEFCDIICKSSVMQISVPILEGKIKYYHENYKDYYYLPEEDMAIHKSVASYVDSSHRKKATANTCYTKIAVTEEFLQNQDSLFSYAAQLLKKVVPNN